MVSRRKRSKTRYAQRLKQSRVNRVHCRLPERLHSSLTLAADGNRWTLSAEVVDRLEQSFATPATPTQALFAIVAHAIDGLRLPPPKNDQQREQEWRKLTKSTWLTDPYLYREAKHAVERALELVAPAKDLPVGEEHPALVNLVVPSGRHGLETWLDEVQSCDPNAKVDNSLPRRAQRQRRLAMLRRGLGQLANELVVRGRTGKEAQRWRRQQKLTLAEQKLLRRLAIIRIETGLTEGRYKRFQELFGRTSPTLRRHLDFGNPFAPSESRSPHDLSDPGPFGKIIDPIHSGDPRDEDHPDDEDNKKSLQDLRDEDQAKPREDLP